MSTIGKWWGRKVVNYKSSPAWLGGYAFGPYVLEPITNKWFGMFSDGTQGSNPGASNIYIRERYSLTNLASTSYLAENSHATRGYTTTGIFTYNGYVYGLRKTSSAGTSLVLYRVDPISGTLVDIKTIYSNTYFQGCAYRFDGTNTVYIIVAGWSGGANQDVVILKYNIQTDTLTTIRTDNFTYVSDAAFILGIGIDTTNIYWLLTAQGTPTTYRNRKMTLAGGSYSESTSVHAIYGGNLGYKGLTLFLDTKTISIQGGSSFTLSSTLTSIDAVCVDDSQGMANARFFVWSSGGGFISFQEYDGSTLKNTVTITATAVTANRSISSTRPQNFLEDAVGFIHHDNTGWLEAPTMMKEVT
jgi:hypothetical protein